MSRRRHVLRRALARLCRAVSTQRRTRLQRHIADNQCARLVGVRTLRLWASATHISQQQVCAACCLRHRSNMHPCLPPAAQATAKPPAARCTIDHSAARVQARADAAIVALVTGGRRRRLLRRWAEAAEGARAMREHAQLERAREHAMCARARRALWRWASWTAAARARWERCGSIAWLRPAHLPQPSAARVRGLSGQSIHFGLHAAASTRGNGYALLLSWRRCAKPVPPTATVKGGRAFPLLESELTVIHSGARRLVRVRQAAPQEARPARARQAVRGQP